MFIVDPKRNGKRIRSALECLFVQHVSQIFFCQCSLVSMSLFFKIKAQTHFYSCICLIFPLLSYLVFSYLSFDTFYGNMNSGGFYELTWHSNNIVYTDKYVRFSHRNFLKYPLSLSIYLPKAIYITIKIIKQIYEKCKIQNLLFKIFNI